MMGRPAAQLWLAPFGICLAVALFLHDGAGDIAPGAFVQIDGHNKPFAVAVAYEDGTCLLQAAGSDAGPSAPTISVDRSRLTQARDAD